MFLLHFFNLCIYFCVVSCISTALDTRVSTIGLSKLWWDSHLISPSSRPRYRNYLTNARLFLAGSRDHHSSVVTNLRNAIFSLHKSANNVQDPERFHLIIGSGGVQIINAAAYAIHRYFNQTVTNFGAVAPHYNHFKLIATHFDGMQWVEHPTEDSIEWVTYPNNPDGKRLSPAFQLDPEKQIYDTVYYWPSYTRNMIPLDHNIMIFSLSKLSGHASTRLGWALVKNIHIAKVMETFIWLQTTHASLESMWFGVQILENILMSKDSYYDYIYNEITYRWDIISTMILEHGQDMIRNLSERGSPCLWLQCLQEDTPCHLQLQTFGIVSEKGSAFGSTNNYSRMCIDMDDPSFDTLQKRFDSFLKKAESQTLECVNCQKHFVT